MKNYEEAHTHTQQSRIYLYKNKIAFVKNIPGEPASKIIQFFVKFLAISFPQISF